MKTTGKHLRSMLVLSLVLVLAGCAGSPKTGPAVSGLMSLDEAIDAIATEIESNVASGTEILVAKISSPLNEIDEYLSDELTGRFNYQGKLITLAREEALEYVKMEQQFQETGFVKDSSSVSIGNFSGAKIVMSGILTQYEAFTQLRLRVVDVETSKTFISSARINNKDPVLSSLVAPLGNIKLEKISDNALTHINNAKDLVAEDKLNEAIGEFDRALAIDGELAEAYYYRAIAHSRNGNTDQAIDDYSNAIRLVPNSYIYYFFRGYEYLDKDDYDSAIADFEQVLKLNPNFGNIASFSLSNAHNDRAIAYHNRGEHVRAIDELSIAIQIDPSNGTAMDNLEIIMNELGVIYFENRDFNSAIVVFEGLLQFDPNNTLAMTNLANAYFSRGNVNKDISNFDQAIEDYTKAIQINPGDLDFYDNRASVYLKKGNMDRAIADFAQGIRLDDADNYNIRGVSLYNQGYIDDAIAHWKAVLQVNPNHTNAKKNLEIAEQQQGR